MGIISSWTFDTYRTNMFDTPRVTNNMSNHDLTVVAFDGVGKYTVAPGNSKDLKDDVAYNFMVEGQLVGGVIYSTIRIGNTQLGRSFSYGVVSDGDPFLAPNTGNYPLAVTGYWNEVGASTPTSIRVTGNLVESVKVNNGTAQSVPHTFDLNTGSNTMVIEGVPRLEQLAIEGDYDSVTDGSNSYPKPADITLDPATSVLTVVNPVKEITVKYTDTAEPTVTVTTNM